MTIWLVIVSQIKQIQTFEPDFLTQKPSQMAQIHTLMGTATNLIDGCDYVIECSQTLHTLQRGGFPL